MIVEKVHQNRKMIAGVMAWLMAAQITLPVFAGGGNNSRHSYPYIPVVPRKGHDFEPSAQWPASMTATGPAGNREARLTKPAPAELLQSQGPAQPEMSSFQSVSTANMVDPFSGDFSYNIPLLDVGGYPVNIHYNSNVTMDQEASWVGLGWNINPGTISRNMRGLPDDFNGVDSIEKTVHTKPNVNVGINAGGGIEVLGNSKIGLDLNVGLSYDNYKGYGIETGIGIRSPLSKSSKSGGGPLSGTLSFTNSSMDGAGIGASLSYSAKIGDTKRKVENGDAATQFGGSLNYSSRAGLTSLSLSANKTHTFQGGRVSLSYGIPGSITFSRPTFTPGTELPYTSLNTSFNFKYGASAVLIFSNVSVGAQVGTQFIADADVTRYFPAYGYLHYSKAAGNKDALLDYNRENDGPYVDKVTPAIAIPQFTYDVYTISAEGTGGSFRPYRSDAGYVYSAYNRTKSGQFNSGLDIGFKHIGINLKPVLAYTTTQAWQSDNQLRNNIAFQQKDSVFEDVVFRNPMEMPVQSEPYLNSIGHDTLVRPVLNGPGQSAVLGSALSAMPNGINSLYDIPLARPVAKEKREKRNQVISYLNAADASLYGLDKEILSYKKDYIPYTYCVGGIDTIARVDPAIRKAHHISEVTVLNEDGRRYIYGVPAYSLNQRSMTFAVKPSSIDNGKGECSYTDAEASIKNKSGVDGYFSAEKVPAYAHSFLLSGILSPDYVDITGNGVTDDDLGDAVKFDYTRVYDDKENSFGWRTPMDVSMASYSPGLKTYNRDDKASIVRGEKEIWYLHSIVSKNMVAVFRTVADRPDAVSQGGINGEVDASKKLQRLTRIDLYTKAALVAGGKPRPVKSVFFEYDYSLCVRDGITGKLTLKKIWFTYNGSGKKSNPYTFNYGAGAAANPVYQPKYTDAWGNYKDPATNPGGLTNQDYPYVVQGSRAVAGQNASVWSLTGISLPSRGSINVTYESDDYGFVQDKRAMQFFKVAGLAASKNGTPQQKLWSDDRSPVDFEYVFIDVPDPVFSKADVYSKYLEGIRQLYLKFYIRVPGDRFGSGYEFVPMVCEIETEGADTYDMVTGNNNRIWLKVKRIGTKPPMQHYALQFLKENLPSKAYPGSETGNDPDLKSIISAIGSQASNIATLVSGFDGRAKKDKVCQEFDAARSFIKLNNPTFTKLGGGLRVSRVEISDNFDAMTATVMKPAVYGQEYDYTTTGTVIENGKQKTIRISSGVATYEPFIGGEENALKGYYAYQQQMNSLGPVSYKFVDTPFCESMFPSASVGYSKVTIRTINKKYLSATGREVYTFFTYKDFPTKWSFTPFDEKSRKRYQPGISNFLKMNARHFLTLSQGFKVELNDMHGKMRSHAFYSEADSVNPITYTENIYRTKTMPGQQQALDNKVWATDGPETAINTNAPMGQGVEIMTDLREQSGFNGSLNLELNVDFVVIPFPPALIPFFGIWPMPQWEKTRFRSASVLKVVNNYGILDSVFQVDKGSAVSTKNLVYDSETGNVLLTRTNNEFKDPVYNFSYPAKWAYSGMGMAYRNIHAEFGKTTALNLKNGRLYDQSNKEFPMERYFESGDECIVSGLFVPGDNLADPDCRFLNRNTDYSPAVSKAWVLDAKKGTSSPPQVFFIDANGRLLNANGVTVKVMRSGFRNLTGSSVGSVTMLDNPIEQVSGKPVIVINNTQKIVNATTATYRDCWKVDNNYYAKDTVIRLARRVDPVTLPFWPTQSYQLQNNRRKKRLKFRDNYSRDLYVADFTMKNYDWGGKGDGNLKTWIRFDLSGIPSTSVISNSSLDLPANMTPGFRPANNFGSNSAYLRRATRSWDYITLESNQEVILKERDEYPTTESATQAVILSTPYTPTPGSTTAPANISGINVTQMVRNMVRDRASLASAIMIGINASNPKGEEDAYSRQSFYSGVGTDCGGKPCPAPTLNVTCFSCNNNETPSFNSSDGKYYCNNDVDTFICKKSITDTTNPYRWGIYGNWRPDKNHVFYDARKEGDPASVTNLRADGTMDAFTPFWEPSTASGNLVKPTTDTTKWVWNTASTLVNSKGAEVESVDALGRYSSGHYGYNDNLPVAVVQNARYRQAAFDGFEDYQYKDQYCNDKCPNPRFADFTKFASATDGVGGVITDSLSHTGLYSLRFKINTTSRVDFPLFDSTGSYKAFPCDSCGVKTKIDSTQLFDTTIVGKGTGMTRTIAFNSGAASCTMVAPVNFVAGQAVSTCGAIATSGYTVTWEGRVQAKESALYTFSTVKSSYSQANSSVFRINGVQTDTITLKAGQLARLTVVFYQSKHPDRNYDGGAGVQLLWKNNQNMPYSQVVPSANQYRMTGFTSNDTLNSMETRFKKWCVRMNRPAANPDTFLVLPLFSPIRKTKSFVVSAWVREDQVCPAAFSPYTALEVSFDLGTASTWRLAATGMPIDGWQRVEAIVDSIPQAAGKLRISFASTGTSFNVDDIRIHPFNASMKSFVYNPFNLRLMAELDENNYASFYEYDDDGTLVRVKKETERGIQTIKETRSALGKP